jgi:glycine betaine/proline transport system ATP-binding protein
MEIRYHTDHSVIIKDEQKVLGVIGDKELYHSLLGKMLLND